MEELWAFLGDWNIQWFRLEWKQTTSKIDKLWGSYIEWWISFCKQQNSTCGEPELMWEWVALHDFCTLRWNLLASLHWISHWLSGWTPFVGWLLFCKTSCHASRTRSVETCVREVNNSLPTPKINSLPTPTHSQHQELTPNTKNQLTSNTKSTFRRRGRVDFPFPHWYWGVTSGTPS